MNFEFFWLYKVIYMIPMLAFLTFSQYRSNMMHLKIKPDVVIIRHGQLMNIKEKLPSRTCGVWNLRRGYLHFFI